MHFASICNYTKDSLATPLVLVSLHYQLKRNSPKMLDTTKSCDRIERAPRSPIGQLDKPSVPVAALAGKTEMCQS